MSQSIVINNLEDLENIRNEIISFALEFDSIAQRKQYKLKILMSFVIPAILIF